MLFVGEGFGADDVGSILNEENVVYPPQIPIITNWRAVVPTNMRPSGPVRVPKRPITRDPRILMIRVPQGNV